MAGGKKPELLRPDGKRADGRGPTDLRPLKITAGVLGQANGSALVEWGKNKVLCGVYGPREVFPKHLSNPYKAIIECKYMMAPFSSIEEHGRAGPNRRAMEINKVAKHVFENVVLTSEYPKTMVNIIMEVLQSDGGTRVAAITGAAVALADAGIPMTDLVQGVSVGKIDGLQVVDLDKYEDNWGASDAPCVVSLRNNEILLYQVDGLLSKEEIKRGLEWTFEAARKIRAEQERALADRFERASPPEKW